MAELLKAAEGKEAELLQANNFLNSEIHSLNVEFEMYKKNYKTKPQGKDEQRLRDRLEKEYDERLRRVVKQY